MLRRLSRLARLLPATLALFLLAGCAGLGGLGGLGAPGGYGTYPQGGYGSERLVATVQYLDQSRGRLVVTPQSGSYGRPDIDIGLDRGTRLFYQGREHPVGGLEPGDVVSIDVVDTGRGLTARTIEVVRNVRDAYDNRYGGGYSTPYPGPGRDGYDSAYGSALEGAVRFVDPGRRVIEIARSGYNSGIERVYYDGGTRFYYRGQMVRPEQLEAGDVVRVDASRTAQGWLARSVTVTMNARDRYR